MNRRDLLLGAASLAACGPAATEVPPAAPFPMRRSVNLGNALEAPSEGAWGYTIRAEHLAVIRDAGFDGVRLPVRWDAHAGAAAPYTIDPAFLSRVTEVVVQAFDLGLQVQLDVHHYNDLIDDPEMQRPRFLAIWSQIAALFRGAPEALIFEALNEPNGPRLSGAALTQLLGEALGVIRPDHPERLVVIGGPNWNSISGLNGWTPPADPHTAITVHYYEPYAFTHQNAEWLGSDAPRFSRAWGAPEDVAAVARHAGEAAAWARRRGLALQLGEFGANRRAPLAQRAAWTEAVRRAFEAEGAAWSVWDFAGAFSIWDAAAGRLLEPMRAALLAP